VTLFQILLLGLYVPLTCLLALYGLHRADVLFAYLRVRKKNPVPNGTWKELPTVLVQLPVYNERTVVRRVLGAVARFDYPRDKLRVQVLDDSTDETVEIARQAVEEQRAAGLDVVLIHRDNREGFKAGALAAGLAVDHAELVAVFDADFMPEPDWLNRVVPYLADPGVGVVQTRWEHLNLDRNVLTKLQGFFLDAHFVLEHTYRNRTGRFINFCGTAGIWRRACIDDAGGWSACSITEDTEISFRAQLRGWRFVYLRDVTVPAELPADVDAYKSQQHRWAKGYTEVLREHLPTIWRAKVPLKIKIEATLMLSNHWAFLLMGALTILHMPIVWVRTSYHATKAQTLLDLLGIGLVILAFFAFYAVGQWEAGRFTWRRMLYVPLALGLGMAHMVNSSRGVLEAVFGVKTEFVRTPKEGDAPAPQSRYKANAAIGQAVVEVAFAVYLLVSCVWIAGRGHWIGAPLNLLVSIAFFQLGLGTLRNRWRPRPAGVPAAAAIAPRQPGHEPEAGPADKDRGTAAWGGPAPAAPE